MNTPAIPPAGYRVPAAAPTGTASEIRATSPGDSFTFSAPTFSSRLRSVDGCRGSRRRPGPWASSQARVTWAGVQDFSRGDGLDLRDERAILVEILLLKARMSGTAAVDVSEAFDRARQETAPQSGE